MFHAVEKNREPHVANRLPRCGISCHVDLLRPAEVTALGRPAIDRYDIGNEDVNGGIGFGSALAILKKPKLNGALAAVAFTIVQS